MEEVEKGYSIANFQLFIWQFEHRVNHKKLLFKRTSFCWFEIERVFGCFLLNIFV